MELILARTFFTNKTTIGPLYLAEVGPEKPICFVLEDKCRQAFGEPFTQLLKIPKQTAIPYGRYEIIVNKSGRFQKLMPRLLKVPFYDGILIHIGNRDVDTEGCLCVGNTYQKDMVLDSKNCFNKILFPLLKKTYDSGEKIWIEITKAKSS